MKWKDSERNTGKGWVEQMKAKTLFQIGILPGIMAMYGLYTFESRHDLGAIAGVFMIMIAVAGYFLGVWFKWLDRPAKWHKRMNTKPMYILIDNLIMSALGLAVALFAIELFFRMVGVQ